MAERFGEHSVCDRLYQSFRVAQEGAAADDVCILFLSDVLDAAVTNVDHCLDLPGAMHQEIAPASEIDGTSAKLPLDFYRPFRGARTKVLS
jgi:hypothetical protein